MKICLVLLAFLVAVACGHNNDGGSYSAKKADKLSFKESLIEKIHNIKDKIHAKIALKKEKIHAKKAKKHLDKGADCSTVMDEVWEEQCGTRYEPSCRMEMQPHCTSIQAKECAPEPQTRCSFVFEDKCKTISVPKCTIDWEKRCTSTPDCTTIEAKSCTDVEKDVCVTHMDKTCTMSTVNVCRKVAVRESTPVVDTVERVGLKASIKAKAAAHKAHKAQKKGHIAAKSGEFKGRLETFKAGFKAAKDQHHESKAQFKATTKDLIHAKFNKGPKASKGDKGQLPENTARLAENAGLEENRADPDFLKLHAGPPSGGDSILETLDEDGNGMWDANELIRRRRGANHAYGKTSQSLKGDISGDQTAYLAAKSFDASKGNKGRIAAKSADFKGRLENFKAGFKAAKDQYHEAKAQFKATTKALIHAKFNKGPKASKGDKGHLAKKLALKGVSKAKGIHNRKANYPEQPETQEKNDYQLAKENVGLGLLPLLPPVQNGEIFFPDGDRIGLDDLLRRRRRANHADRTSQSLKGDISGDQTAYLAAKSFDASKGNKGHIAAKSADFKGRLETFKAGFKAAKDQYHEAKAQFKATTKALIHAKFNKGLKASKGEKGLKASVPTIRVRYEKSCQDEPRKICTQTPRQDCHKEVVPLCKSKPRETCVQKEKCKSWPKKNCGMVHKEACLPFPTKKCTEISTPVCRIVPRQECTEKKHEICETVPTKDCQKVLVSQPRTVCIPRPTTRTIEDW